jgi:hypothetical protein
MLPEFKKREGYRVKVVATYQDYRPIAFDLNVKYMHTVNSKFKFLDLGTHVFYKFPVSLRPWG